MRRQGNRRWGFRGPERTTFERQDVRLQPGFLNRLPGREAGFYLVVILERKWDAEVEAAALAAAALNHKAIFSDFANRGWVDYFGGRAYDRWSFCKHP